VIGDSPAFVAARAAAVSADFLRNHVKVNFFMDVVEVPLQL
jgi:hypothetical protein